LEWLWAHAAETLVALGVFILFWLWRVALRFGPLQPSPEPNRRSLLEHVRALGRFYVDQDQLPELVRRMRVDAQALFDRAAPELHGADGGQRLKEAARLTRIRARDLLAAFTQHPSGPKEFTYTVRTLALFRSRLERRSVDSENP
jgi:hypothetical protein